MKHRRTPASTACTGLRSAALLVAVAATIGLPGTAAATTPPTTAAPSTTVPATSTAAAPTSTAPTSTAPTTTEPTTTEPTTTEPTDPAAASGAFPSTTTTDPPPPTSEARRRLAVRPALAEPFPAPTDTPTPSHTSGPRRFHLPDPRPAGPHRAQPVLSQPHALDGPGPIGRAYDVITGGYNRPPHIHDTRDRPVLIVTGQRCRSFHEFPSGIQRRASVRNRRSAGPPTWPGANGDRAQLQSGNAGEGHPGTHRRRSRHLHRSPRRNRHHPFPDDPPDGGNAHRPLDSRLSLDPPTNVGVDRVVTGQMPSELG